MLRSDISIRQIVVFFARRRTTLLFLLSSTCTALCFLLFPVAYWTPSSSLLAVCQTAFNGGDLKGIVDGQTLLLRLTHSKSAAADYCDIFNTSNAARCECFRIENRYFTASDITQEELAFPLAFSLLIYEQPEQVERLLRLIYRPHNVYCIHVDRKASAAFHRYIESVVACLVNVFIAKPAIDVRWANISIIDAEMLCMKQLLEYHVKWKYFTNWVGFDFPLRTNHELVQIFKAYGGANDIRGITVQKHNRTFNDASQALGARSRSAKEFLLFGPIRPWHLCPQSPGSSVDTHQPRACTEQTSS